MTSHGGVVLSDSATSNWYGIPIARKGDGVYCPKCKPHFFKIEEGLSNSIDHGAEMAGEGHLTTCGAKLIAQAAPFSLFSAAKYFIDGKGFDDRYVLKDASGQPMPNTYYASQKEGNELEYGTTDEAGHTHLHLTGEDSAQVAFYIAG
jgi:uncharacterized Zn-binding protein involved in type VI secretion